MATRSILCVSWNLELQCPDKQALTDSFVNYIKSKKNNKPSLIVIGLQEATSYDNWAATFIGEKLARPELLGRHYTLLASERFKGITKGKQIIGHKANQVIQVLGHKNAKISAETDQSKKKWYGEKGFCFAGVNMDGKNLGFISTHLSSDTDAAKKQNEGKKILEFLKEEAKSDTFDALFMMGDLNFRVKQEGAAGDKKSVQRNLLSPGGRLKLQQHDSFDPQAFAKLPFIWPPHEAGTLPTYKRKKDKSVYGTIRRLKSREGIDNRALLNLYPIGSKQDRPGFWDFGWLDRIGYACVAPGQFNQRAKLGHSMFKSRLKLQNTDVVVKSFYYVPYGDHVPVYCDFLFSGF